jgi:hypothetical protein
MVRREILRLLDRAGSLGLFSLKIWRSLSRYLEDLTLSEIERDLTYLAEEGTGYVRVELIEQETGSHTKLATITAKGQNLLLRAIPPDPGVD